MLLQHLDDYLIPSDPWHCTNESMDLHATLFNEKKFSELTKY